MIRYNHIPGLKPFARNTVIRKYTLSVIATANSIQKTVEKDHIHLISIANNRIMSPIYKKTLLPGFFIYSVGITGFMEPSSLNSILSMHTSR